MALPAFNAEGLLPPGAHPASLSEVRSALVNPQCGDEEMRSAVFSALATWVTLARRAFGPGMCLLGGGFVSSGEASDTAMVVYLPDDDTIAEAAARSDSAVDLVSLRSVIYSYPVGGGLPERWPVSTVLDAHVTDRHAARAFRHALGSVIAPSGMATVGIVKGYVELEVRLP